MTVFCTDSLSVLMMMKNVNKRFLGFVANRMAKIEQASIPAQSGFTDSRSNATNHASIGLTASELIANDGWFECSTMASFKLGGD